MSNKLALGVLHLCQTIRRQEENKEKRERKKENKRRNEGRGGIATRPQLLQG